MVGGFFVSKFGFIGFYIGAIKGTRLIMYEIFLLSSNIDSSNIFAAIIVYTALPLIVFCNLFCTIQLQPTIVYTDVYVITVIDVVSCRMSLPLKRRPYPATVLLWRAKRTVRR